VWKVCYKKTGKIYAIKEMSKAKIIDKKSVDSVLGEKNLLSEIHHPFIVNMIYSFQDHDYLYLVMDLLPGGNLRYHISSKRHFNEKQNKFLIGCILVGLEYIHGQNILHRDIKPENLVFDSNGYLRITDFGIAKKYVVNNKKDTSGTVGYLAPEVLCNENHTFSIDYYAVGIITYELAYGHRPYIGKTKHEVKQLILTRQAHIDYDDLPEGYENEAADFINKLIQRKPKNRLGKGGIKEVINHPWLKGFDWENMKSKSLKAYYFPKEGDNYDKKYCLQSNKMGTDTIERYKIITNDPNYEIIFKNFDCEKIPEELKIFTDKNKIGDSLINNGNISSNNSTTSISRNNKINFNNNNNNINNNNDGIKKNNNNKYPNSNSNSLLARQRNKSMENIFIDQKGKINIDKENGEKSLVKQVSAINIISKKNNIIIKDDEDKIKKEEKNNKNINNENIKDSNKKPDSNINVISDINEKEHQKKNKR
jgi:serine/threonine protein kinase